MPRWSAWILAWILFADRLLAGEPPARLKWETANAVTTLGSPEAKRGGRIVAPIAGFPLTIRQVGPDAASPFRHFLDENDLSLIMTHPNQDRWLPLLATHWALGADGRTVYYRLNPAARWSDGETVKASDYVFTWEFMRSPVIQSPWANAYYWDTIEAVETFQEKSGTEVVGIRLAHPDSDRLALTNIKPMPRHFYGTLPENFVTAFNWKIPPSPGPYTITRLEKGQSILFSRNKNWWGDALPFFQNRFNVDEVVLKPVPDIQIAYAYLKAGDLDAMTITSPDLWHAGDRDEPFVKGYIHRLQAWQDTPRNGYVLILNQAHAPLADPLVREALAHALNIERVIQELLHGDFERLQGISQGYGAYTNPRIKARGFDLKKADALLQKAGWQTRNAEGIRVKDGRTLTLTLTYSQSNMTPRFVLLQEDARKAGFDLKLQLMDQALAYKMFQEKKHDIAFWAWTTPYRPEYRTRFHSSGAGKGPNANFSNTARADLDQLIEAYDKAGTDAERIPRAHAIQEKVFEDASYIPLFEVPFYRLAHWSWIRFPEPSGTKISDGLSFFDPATGGFFWVDGERQKLVQEARRKGTALPAVTRLDPTFQRRNPAP